MSEIEFVIVRHVGVLAEAGKGWKKELNVVSWNKREPKYDIRDWDPGHEKMGKGVTLAKAEAEALVALLKSDIEANGGPGKA
jgi:hypothetical protein